MNEETKEKALKQLDTAGEIYSHVIDLATEIVDEKYPAHKQRVGASFLPWKKYDCELERYSAISGVVVNILELAERLRL